MIHDQDERRRDALIGRLRSRCVGEIARGSPDPTGFDLIVNATPTGMRVGDPYPLRADRLLPDMFVGDVITAPMVTPLVEEARRIGCKTQIGFGMFTAELALMVDFLSEDMQERARLDVA